MADVITIGEIFTQYISENNTNESSIKIAGGASVNIAASLTKLGTECKIIAKTGNDENGAFIRKYLTENGLSADGIITDNKCITDCLTVEVSQNGERKSSFSHSGSMKPEDVDLSLLDDCRMLHIGAYLLSEDTSWNAVVNAIKYARSKKILICYDPNYRKVQWKSPEEAAEKMQSILGLCDIVKLSENEFSMITESDYLIRGIAYLLQKGIKIILVTQGAGGCIIASRKGIRKLSAFNVPVKDATGAGDCFFGAFLYEILSSDKSIDDIEMEELCGFCEFSNAAGAACSMKSGGIISVPDLEEIQSVIRNSNI